MVINRPLLCVMAVLATVFSHTVFAQESDGSTTAERASSLRDRAAAVRARRVATPAPAATSATRSRTRSAANPASVRTPGNSGAKFAVSQPDINAAAGNARSRLRTRASGGTGTGGGTTDLSAYATKEWVKDGAEGHIATMTMLNDLGNDVANLGARVGMLETGGGVGGGCSGSGYHIFNNGICEQINIADTWEDL